MRERDWEPELLRAGEPYTLDCLGHLGPNLHLSFPLKFGQIFFLGDPHIWGKVNHLPLPSSGEGEGFRYYLKVISTLSKTTF
jgi:hypothetical protein